MSLNSSTWIAIYLPMIIMFVVILPRRRKIMKLIMIKVKKRRGKLTLGNDVLKRYVGERCKLVTGALGTTVKGKIIEVNDNWIEIQTKAGQELINADFVQSVKIVK